MTRGTRGRGEYGFIRDHRNPIAVTRRGPVARSISHRGNPPPTPRTTSSAQRWMAASHWRRWLRQAVDDAPAFRRLGRRGIPG